MSESTMTKTIVAALSSGSIVRGYLTDTGIFWEFTREDGYVTSIRLSNEAIDVMVQIVAELRECAKEAA